MGKGANGRLNCLTGVCCDSIEARQNALRDDLVEHGGCTAEEAYKAACRIFYIFDVLPKGTIEVKHIARLAREGYTKDKA